MLSYKQRLVENTKINDAVIDTVLITDLDGPYETAIKHPKYNNGNWIVVKTYEDKTKAKEGHKRWVELFNKGLPDELSDNSTLFIKKTNKLRSNI